MTFRPLAPPRIAVSFFAYALTALPDAAFARTCTDDAECAPEEYCNQSPSAGDSSESSGAAAEPCAPGDPCEGGDPIEPAAVEAPTEGECERGGRTCSSDEECLPDHFCEFDSVDVACAPGVDCSDVANMPASGRCQHEPYLCEADADCPEPTVCGPDGECLLELTECESDSNCDARYECISIRGGGSDDSSDGDDPGQGSAGVDDSAEPPASADSSGSEPGAANDDRAAAEAEAAQAAEAEAAQAEAETSDEAASICFPAASPCETDADCSDGWVCGEVEGAPPSWGDVERSCLPPGIAAVFDGDIDVEGGGGSNTSGESPEEDGEGQSPIGEGDPDGVAGFGTQGGSEGSEAGCQVATAAGRANTLLAVLAAALGLVFTRRRRVHQPR